MGDFDRFRSVFSIIIACSVAIIRFADSSSVTWFKPPPFETVTDPAITSEANKSLIKGSLNEEMDCNFNVTADLSLITVSMKFEGWSVATFVKSQRALSVQPGFESRFNATWVPYRLTLIFFNVTSADKGEYSCEVLTLRGRSAQIWVRKIQVSLLEKESSSVSTTSKSAPERESSGVSTTPTSAPEKESPSVSATLTSSPAVSGTTTHVYYGQARELVFVLVLISIINSLL